MRGPALTVAAVACLALLFHLVRPPLPPLTAADPPPARGAEIHAHTGSAPTVAVLPFEAMSGSSEQLYLARGLAAELTANLSRLSGVTVIGTSPIRTEAGDGRPPLAAARYRLWGFASREGERIRLRLTLIEAATGEQAWARGFNRPFAQVAQLPEESALAVAQALGVSVTTGERRRLARRCTQSAEAYDLFLRAQAKLLAGRAKENRHARELYRQALSVDPSFARALGGIALTHAADFRNQWVADGAGALALAREAAEAAARVGPDLREVLWVLAYVHVREGDHETALRELDRSLTLDPSFADAFALKAGVMTYLGAPAEAVTLVTHAMRLNPGAGYLYFLILGRALFYLGAADEAVLNLRAAAARNPANLEVRVYLAAALTGTSDQDATEWEALEIANLSPGFSLNSWLERHPLRGAGHRKRLISALRGIGLSR